MEKRNKLIAGIIAGTVGAIIGFFGIKNRKKISKKAKKAIKKMSDKK